MQNVIRTGVALSFAFLVRDAAAQHSVTSAKQRPHVITVRMTRDEKGERFFFNPARVDARVGDTLRFVNGLGKHNVNFLPDSNSKRATLPEMTPLLETAGEKSDIVVTLPPGRYFFQCDPHVGKGMVGHLVVKARGA